MTSARWAAALLVALVAASPRVARADERDEAADKAEALAARAYDEVAAGRHAEAIDLYEKAYDAAPAARILLDVADVYWLKLRDGKSAAPYYQRYVDAPDAEPDLVRKARARLDEIASPRPPPRAEAPASAAPAASSSPMRTWGFVAGGVGLAALAAGAAFGLVAKSKNDEAEKSCNGQACTDPRALDLTDSAAGFARAADVAFVAGGVLLAGGVALVLLAPRSAAPAVRVSSSLGPRSAGLVVSGSWH